jgi:hypothetical protein
LVLGLVLGYGVSPVSALSFTGTYFKIVNPGAVAASGNVGNNTGNTSVAFSHVCAQFTCFGAVANSVGALSGGQPTAAGNHWTEANGSQILLWTLGSNPGGNVLPDKVDPADVFFNGAGGVTTFLPTSGFFPTLESGNTNFYRSVHWTGLFSAPAGATFTIASDDHAFLYVNGILKVDAGGIKPLIQTFTGHVDPSVGNLSFDLFFADVFFRQSGLYVACKGCEDPLGAVPEPTSLLLFGTTLAGLGAVVRRKFRRQASTI